VKRGGHNPLEPAQFSVPVVIGSSFENFRDITRRMMEAKAIRVVDDEDDLHETLINFLSDGEAARAMGERGRKVFEQQQGATGRAVEAIVAMIHTGAKP
jgi:3-deoxy-D-manno-octulosonic-acid transferase